LLFHLAPITRADSGGREHWIAVPYSTPVKLTLLGSIFRLDDAVGQPLSRTQATLLPLIVSPSQTMISLKYTVTGLDN
jgi:hypothetical protein